MGTTRIAITLSTCLAVFAIACSSPEPVSNPNGGREPTTTPDKTKTPPGGKETPTPPGGDPAPTTPGGDPAPTGGDGSACLKETNAQGCFTCCDKIDPKAFEEAQKASETCLCGATGACKTQCASSICKNPDSEPDQACETCLGTAPAQKCEDTFIQTCEAKATCKTVMGCEDKCADKFPQQGGQGGGGG